MRGGHGLFALLLATASPAMAAPPAPSSPVAVTKDGTIPPPPEGKAQVVFFRPGRLVGMSIHAWVKEELGGADVARLGNGQYWPVLVEPGPRNYFSQSGTRDNVTFDLAPGETKFVEVSVGFGSVTSANHLTPAAEDYARKKLRRLRRASPPSR